MKNLKRYFLTIVSLVLMISTASCTETAARPIQPGDTTRKLMVTGLDREYLLHIPSGLDSSRTVPVVFAFHGFGSHSSEMQTLIGFDAIADKNGWIVVYPQGSGTDLSWNGRICCGTAWTDKVDEPAFIRQILSDLGTIASIDSKRIYALGFSNGGAVVYRLGCEMSDTFAAIASVSSAFGGPCQPQQPVSFLYVHGLADTLVPYEGGGDIVPGGFPPIEQGITTWVQLNGCTDAAKVEKQQSIITHTLYGSCRDGTAIELYTVDGARSRVGINSTKLTSLQSHRRFLHYPFKAINYLQSAIYYTTGSCSHNTLQGPRVCTGKYFL